MQAQFREEAEQEAARWLRELGSRKDAPVLREEVQHKVTKYSFVEDDKGKVIAGSPPPPRVMKS